jgi:RimJ/RimL family protein N-acetyltransferase
VRAAAFRPPVTLVGRYLELVPLETSHAAALLHAARDPEVSRFLVAPIGPGLGDVQSLIALLLRHQEEGHELAFVTRLRRERTVVGASRFIHLDVENGSVEIGGTFLDSEYWRSPLNTDAKLAMLRHAFEVGGAHRVWLQTDVRNVRSQAAIARLGAVREGVHREDRLLSSGSYRSSVVFSILSSEWPTVRSDLEAKLGRPWSPPPAAVGPRPTDGP